VIGTAPYCFCAVSAYPAPSSCPLRQSAAASPSRSLPVRRRPPTSIRSARRASPRAARGTTPTTTAVRASPCLAEVALRSEPRPSPRHRRHHAGRAERRDDVIRGAVPAAAGGVPCLARRGGGGAVGGAAARRLRLAAGRLGLRSARAAPVVPVRGHAGRARFFGRPAASVAA